MAGSAADLQIALRLRDEASAELRKARHEISALESTARAASGTITSFFTGAAREALGFGTAMIAANAAMAAGTRAFEAMSGAVFGMNATLETSTLQFKTLMGDADLAKDHVKDLFIFAKDTPFETGPIIAASRILEVMGGATLNTMANLTLFGDAAAATGAPLDTLTQYIGRMYAALQTGKPFGESLERFRELGVLSPQVSAQLADISEKGGDAAKAWRLLTDDLHRYDGAMKEQAHTWEGLTSTYRDTINILLAQTFKPFFSAAEEGLSGLNDLLGSPAAEEWSKEMAARFEETLKNAGILKDGFVEEWKAMDKDGIDPLTKALKIAAAAIGEELGESAKTNFEMMTTKAGTVAETIGSIGNAAYGAITGVQALANAIRDMPGLDRTFGLPSGDDIKSALSGPGFDAQRAGERANAPDYARPPINGTGLTNYNASVSERNAFVAQEMADRTANAKAEADANTWYWTSGPGAPVRATRTTNPTPFSNAPGRGGGGGGGGGGGSHAAPKLPAIAGFMESDSASSYDALFGKDFGGVASALDKALRENTEASGTAVRKAMESAATALREAGDTDWKPAIEDLAGYLHDALVDKTPEAVAAAQEMLAVLGRAIDENKLNTKMNEAAKKLNDSLTEMAASSVKAINSVYENRELQDHIKEIRDVFDTAQSGALKAFQSGQADQGTTRGRTREDFYTQQGRDETLADAKEAHEKALVNIRKTMSGQQERDAITAEQKRYKEEAAAMAKAVARDDKHRDQQRTDQDDDRLFAQHQADQLDAFQRQQREARDTWERENIEDPAMARQIANIIAEFDARKEKELRTYAETTADLALLYGDRLDVMAAVEKADADAQAAAQASSNAIAAAARPSGVPYHGSGGSGRIVGQSSPYSGDLLVNVNLGGDALDATIATSVDRSVRSGTLRIVER